MAFPSLERPKQARGVSLAAAGGGLAGPPTAAAFNSDIPEQWTRHRIGRAAPEIDDWAGTTRMNHRVSAWRANVFAALLRELDADREARVVRREAPDPHLNHVSRSRQLAAAVADLSRSQRAPAILRVVPRRRRIQDSSPSYGPMRLNTPP